MRDLPNSNTRARVTIFIQIGNHIPVNEVVTYGKAVPDRTFAVTEGQLIRVQASAGEEPEDACIRQPTLHR